MDPRKSVKSRKTNETDIRVSLNLDGTGEHRIATGDYENRSRDFQPWLNNWTPVARLNR